MTTARPAPYRAARELWAIRQLVGFGLKLSVRDYLRLSALASAVLVLLAVVAGDLSVAFGIELLGGSERRRTGEAIALVVTLLAAYVAVLDVVRGSVTSLRIRVSGSPLRGLWAALDVGPFHAVMAERGVGVLVRSAALAALVCGAGLRLAREGSAVAGDVIGLGAALGAAHAGTTIGLALLHARRDARAVGARWSWIAVALPAGLAGVGAARLIAAADTGAEGARWRERMLAWALDLDAAQSLTVLCLAALVPLAGGIACAVIGVVAVDAPRPPAATDAARSGVVRDGWSLGRNLTRAAEVGTGMARRAVAVDRLLAFAAALAAAALGWRLGGGSLLPAGDQAERIVVVYGVLAATVISSITVVVAGQQATLATARHLWELGASAGALYRATLLVAVRRLVLLQASLTALALLGWGIVSWRLVVVTCAVVVGDLLVDSLFARPRAGDSDVASDPASAAASIGLVLIVTVAALAGGLLAATALVLFALMIGVAGPWMFASRLRRVPVIAP